MTNQSWPIDENLEPKEGEHEIHTDPKYKHEPKWEPEAKQPERKPKTQDDTDENNETDNEAAN